VPYHRFADRELGLTDDLAIDRTVLAAERTLLAYVRTALALGVIGATLLHFREAHWQIVGGWVCAALGGLVLVIGVVQFLRQRRRMGPVLRRRR
jgi:putative membrane protein